MHNILTRARTTADLSSQMLEIMAEHGYAPLAPKELPAARAMTCKAMNCEVASIETFLRVQALQPAAAMAWRDQGVVLGVVGFLLLRPAGYGNLERGRFDACDVDFSLLSRPLERPGLGYSWGIACVDKRASAAAFAMSEVLRQGPFHGLPFFARAVSSVGRHVAITRGGYRPLRHAADDLLVRDPIRLEAAA